MKLFLSFVIGLLGALLAAVFYSLASIFADIDLSGFFMFFIVPVGAFIMGMGSTIGIYIGLKKNNIKPEKSHSFLYGLVAFICFAGIYFSTYSLTYVSSDYKINHAFSGKHISNFYLMDSGEKINFLTYLNFEITSRSYSGFMSWGKAGNGAPINIPSTGNGNWLMLLIECAGFITGGVIRVQDLKSTGYCEDCKKYIKKKKVSAIKLSIFKSIIADRQSLSFEELMDIVKEKRRIPFLYLGKHIRFDVYYCPECTKGTLSMNQMEFDGYKFQAKPSQHQKFELEKPELELLL